MKRKRRVICEDFPTGDMDVEEIKRGFRELRKKRLERERRARLAAGAKSVPRAGLGLEPARSGSSAEPDPS